MATITWFVAAILGIVEGLTEYLPVSSTAHIDLAGRWLGVADVPGFASFDIVIQLGAILAVLVHYRGLIGERVRGLMVRDPVAIRLFLALGAGFLPAAVLGLLARSLIKTYLFGVTTIAVAFVIGGVVMLAVEAWRRRRRGQWRDGLEQIGLRDGLLIGLGQCFTLVPGMSRSMSTIVPGQLLGLSTATAAEFSFLLGLHTLGAATIYEGLKERQALAEHAGSAVLVGLVVSFFVAWAVIAGFLRYLKRRGLVPFGYYRIVVGALLLWVAMTPHRTSGSRAPTAAPPRTSQAELIRVRKRSTALAALNPMLGRSTSVARPSCHVTRAIKAREATLTPSSAAPAMRERRSRGTSGPLAATNTNAGAKMPRVATVAPRPPSTRRRSSPGAKRSSSASSSRR